MKKTAAKRAAFSGLLAALAIVLSFLEGTLPALPMMPPGAKLGLSNIVTMYAADTLGLPTAIVIALIKGGFALLTRGLTAGVMSTAGGILSTIAVWLLLKHSRASYILIGISGALSHNLGQFLVALFLTRAAVIYYIPALVIFALISGVLTGLLLRIISPYLDKLNKLGNT